jgi:hypothetical protein
MNKYIIYANLLSTGKAARLICYEVMAKHKASAINKARRTHGTKRLQGSLVIVDSLRV